MSMIRFEAELFNIGSWTILLLPKDVSAKLPSRGQVMVSGTINGVDFQLPLEPDGNGSHWFRVDKALQKSTESEEGDTVTMEVEPTPTKDWPEPEIPKDLQAAIDASTPEVQQLWTKVTPMAHWEWLRWINATKNPETRKKRIEVSISKLSKGMRRPCCFNRNMCCIPDVSKNGVLLEPTSATT